MAPKISLRCVLLRSVLLAWVGMACGLPTLAAGEVPAAPAPTAPGPIVRRLTLEEARQLALAQNKELALGRLNVAQLQHATDAASKDYFPKVLGSETYFHFNHNLGDVLTVQTRGRRGVLPPGFRTIDVAVLNRDTSLATVFVAQPITKLIAVNAAVQAARADENAAQAKLDKGTRDLLSGVSQAYHALLGAQRIQAALELQVRLLEQVLSAKPVPELRVGLLEARQGLVQVRGQIQDLTNQLNSLLDLPPCTVLELVDPLPQPLPVRCSEDAAERAVANNPEIREAEQSITKAEAGLKVARMDYLPDVNIIGGYANQTGASYVQDNISYIGIAASYTFWDWGKRRDVKWQRQTQIALAHQNLQVTIDKVRLEARKAYVSFEQARETYQLATEMVLARKEAEKTAAGPAVLQAKAETSKAELESMKAEIAYRVAHAQLAALLCLE